MHLSLDALQRPLSRALHGPYQLLHLGLWASFLAQPLALADAGCGVLRNDAEFSPSTAELRLLLFRKAADSRAPKRSGGGTHVAPC